jgi:hypothetical protein
MLHNETINIWSHLIGMTLFIFLVNHMMVKFEPSPLYYQIGQNNNNEDYRLSIALQNLFKSFNQREISGTCSSLPEFLETDSYCEASSMWSNVVTGLDDDDSADSGLKLMMDSMLQNSHFDEWVEEIQFKKSNMFLYFESQKAIHAHNFEMMELYVQNAMDQVKTMATTVKNSTSNSMNFKTCKNCMEQFFNVLENIPNQVQDKIDHVMNHSIADHKQIFKHTYIVP